MKKIVTILLLAISIISCKKEVSSKEDKKTDVVKNTKTAPIFKVENESVVFKNNLFDNGVEKYSIVFEDTGDVNKDGKNDFVALIKQETKGTGTFYHLNLLLADADGKLQFADQKFIGDRIKPEYLTILKAKDSYKETGIAVHKVEYGHIVLGYFARAKDQSFSETPKFYLTPKWEVENGKLEVVEMN